MINRSDIKNQAREWAKENKDSFVNSKPRNLINELLRIIDELEREFDNKDQRELF